MNKYEKALEKLCDYVHYDGIGGCPFKQDITLLNDEKYSKCIMCDYSSHDSDSEIGNEDFRKKSIECWEEWSLKDE